jgi:hypothetical protein
MREWMEERRPGRTVLARLLPSSVKGSAGLSMKLSGQAGRGPPTARPASFVTEATAGSPRSATANGTGSALPAIPTGRGRMDLTVEMGNFTLRLKTVCSPLRAIMSCSL